MSILDIVLAIACAVLFYRCLQLRRYALYWKAESKRHEAEADAAHRLLFSRVVNPDRLGVWSLDDVMKDRSRR